jgi:ketosteroid isomerase-like protein
MDIQDVIYRYHKAVDEFSRGDPLPVKMLFSHWDDVTLANPFGPPVRGWTKASEALDFASSRFKDGEVSFDLIARYETSELVTLFEIENWKAKVGGRQEVSPFVLRVTSTFRREDGDWKLVHRHADPITSFHPDGPLRSS